MAKRGTFLRWKFLFLFLFFTGEAFAQVKPVDLYLSQIEVSRRIHKDSPSHPEELKLLEERLGELESESTFLLNPSEKSSRKGKLDPDFPVSFRTKPERFSLSSELQGKLFSETVGFISFKDLTASRLKRLSSRDFISLLHELEKKSFKLQWKNKRGRCQSGKKVIGLRLKHWEKSNGAAVLALVLGMEKEKKLLEKLLLTVPDAVTKTLKGTAFSILNEKLVAKVLVKLIKRSSSENYHKVASSAANVAQVYISYWADKKAHRLMLALTGLVLESSKTLKRNSYVFSSAEKGILLGALLSGALLRAREIKSQDERKLWVVNSIANLTWAASTFLGALPIAGTISAAVAASFSVAVVAWDVVVNKIGVRDFSPGLKEIEGHIEFAVLETMNKKKASGGILEAMELLAWMRSTIHINGLSD